MATFRQVLRRINMISGATRCPGEGTTLNEILFWRPRLDCSHTAASYRLEDPLKVYQISRIDPTGLPVVRNF